MPRAARSLDDALERLRRENDADGQRFVDMRLRFVLDAEPENENTASIRSRFVDVPTDVEDGQEVLDVGGRWDRRVGSFVDDAPTAVYVRFHPGQLRAVQWFCAWLDAHAERRISPPPFDPDRLKLVLPHEVYSALFAGGRRGGKTWILIALAVAYAIRFPGSIVWLVSPSNERHFEIQEYVNDLVRKSWLDEETNHGWELCNGSRLMLKSAFGTGDQLKEGKANLVVLNEGQKMKERAFVVCRGAIVDSSGIVMVGANPPVELDDQHWVSNFAADATAQRRAAVYLHFNPLLNWHIDRAGLLALQNEVDERTYLIEVLGHFLPAKNAVIYNWVRTENELPTPHPKWDCTERFLEAIGEGVGIKHVVGLDVQRVPYIGGPVYRFYGRPEPDHVLMWGVDEIVLDGGDEVEFCAALLDRGYLPEETLIVCDASGRYQHSRRRAADAPPPEWTGRGSFAIIRGEGFTRIVPPDRRQKRNPAIVDRVRAFTSMVATKSGTRRIMFDLEHAPRTCAALRDWKTNHGAPSRSQYEAHLGDGASYPVVRFFPRRFRSLDLREAAKSTNPPRIADAPVPGLIEAPRIGDHAPKQREGRRARR